MSLFSFLGALEIGAIYSLVALGVLISFRLLRFPDLTVDGSFALGGAVCAILISGGHNPFFATLMATAAGFCAGLVTAFLNVKFKIMDLLAGILVMTALYSVNLRVMGAANVSLLGDPTVFTMLQIDGFSEMLSHLVIMAFIIVIVKLFLDWFFSTETGLAIRATGTNARMARAQGIPTGTMLLLGVAISNALVGLAGAFFVQSQGGADASMGIGTIVIGLASVIVGEKIIPARRLIWTTLAVIVGAVLYRLFIALALEVSNFGYWLQTHSAKMLEDSGLTLFAGTMLKMLSEFILWVNLQAQDLNLITAVLVTIALVIPLLKKKMTSSRGK